MKRNTWERSSPSAAPAPDLRNSGFLLGNLIAQGPRSNVRVQLIQIFPDGDYFLGAPPIKAKSRTPPSAITDLYCIQARGWESYRL